MESPDFSCDTIPNTKCRSSISDLNLSLNIQMQLKLTVWTVCKWSHSQPDVKWLCGYTWVVLSFDSLQCSVLIWVDFIGFVCVSVSTKTSRGIRAKCQIAVKHCLLIEEACTSKVHCSQRIEMNRFRWRTSRKWWIHWIKLRYFYWKINKL